MSHSEGTPEKASSLATKRGVYRVWLGPTLGALPLNEITDERVSELRSTLTKAPGRKPGATLSKNRINNILWPLNSCLQLAVKWKVIAAMPCTIEIPAVNSEKPEFYDFDDYARLCDGAAKAGSRELALVRLGGDAGLRRGEQIALRWSDCDFRRRQIHVEQAAWRLTKAQARALGASSEWKIGKPKSGKGRVIPMTDALHAALQAHRHLRGEYVLSLDDGSPAPGHVLRDWLESAQRRAGLTVLGAMHKLRHSFCSHLAMRGAPAKAIQELAGHSSLTITMRYMHLSAGALDSAIALLNSPSPGATVGATAIGSS
jgi:integrase